MNYIKIYNSLIQKRHNNPILKDQQYCEQHHIVPRCLHGSNNKSNLINLTAREHYIAHLLLRKIYPNVFGLSIAIEIMQAYSHFNIERKSYKFNSRLFELIRKYNANYLSKRQSSLRWICNSTLNKQTYWPKNKPLPDSMILIGWKFGRLKNKCYHMSDDTRKQWIINIRNTKKNFSTERKADIIQRTEVAKQITIKNRSPERKKEISNIISTANKRRWKNTSQQQKNKIYQKVSATSKRTWKNKSIDDMKKFSEHQSQVNKGRVWITNLKTMKTKHVWPNELEFYIQNGWTKGRFLS